MVELGEALRHNSTLEQLILANCTVNDDGVRLLASQLKQNPTSKLAVIDLARNSEVSEEAVALLRGAKVGLRVSYP